MIVLIPFLHVLGPVLVGIGSLIWSCFFVLLAHDVLCAVWTAENITYVYDIQNYLQLRRSAPKLASRQVQFVQPNPASIAHLSRIYVYVFLNI